MGRGALGAWNGRQDQWYWWNVEDVKELNLLNEMKPGMVDIRKIGPDEYFSELANYRFLVAPKGQAIQSCKFAEAVLMMTIPITKRYKCFQDLQDYGFPIVL